MKKAILFAFALCMLASIGSAQSLGDVNSDGNINIVDALRVAQYYVGSNPQPFNPGVADVDGNSSINIVDALLIAQYYVGIITSFPAQNQTPVPTAAVTPAPVTGNFPYAGKPYPYGIASASTDQAGDNNFILSEYSTWKSAYVTSDGAGGNLRVRRPQNSNDTVSEGIGYGMLISVYMDDKSTFDGFWNYAKAHRNSRGFMHWQINSSGQVIGQNAATDADEDMALALVFASKKWGGNYASEASALINAMLNHMVEASTWVVKPGDAWGGSNCTNISYFSPGAYRIFASFTGNSNWNNVVNKCYQIINAARNNSTGLIPDWCTASGGSTPEVDFDQYKDHYYYDAIRFPMRIAWDYLWFGDSQASSSLTTITNFFAGIGATSIHGGYYLTGGVIGNYHDAGFVATAAAGSMGTSNVTFARALLAEMKRFKSNEYFQDILRMMCLLVSTGNFPNLYNY